MIEQVPSFLLGFGCGVFAVLSIYMFYTSERRGKSGLPIAPEAFKKKA